MFDVNISGGTVVDGSGSEPFRADVAITGNKIMGLGDYSGQVRMTTIDASGCLVTPGWVDVHTHYDGQVTWDPILAPWGFPPRSRYCTRMLTAYWFLASVRQRRKCAHSVTR
jgi:cytosine/adenosine deaminase-related metal-dependent hydrolase